MNDYKQPSFYHFSQDSISLANFVIQDCPNAKRILDLGAGSGVIGIEVSRFLNPQILHSLEVQIDYKECLEINMKTFLPQSCFGEIEINSFRNFIPKEKFDLIVCNPPYYFPDSGQRALDPRRDIARSFSIDDWPSLFDLIRRSLSKDGKAYFVLKNEKKSLERILSSLPQEIDHKLIESDDLVFLILS